MNKLHVKKGDTVIVLSGKDKGKQGKVLEVSPKEGKVIVDHVNMMTKHTRIAHKVLNDGKKERICKNPKCGETF